MTTDEIKIGLMKMIVDSAPVRCAAFFSNPNRVQQTLEGGLGGFATAICDTELDYICHLLESQMTPEELDTYYYDFLHVKDEDHAYAAIANWEKRGPAILRFRGIAK